MTIFRHIFPAFVAGEIDPMMHGRVDTEQYGYGLERCENFVPMNEGPIVKRPGFGYIRDAAPTASWLGSFRFSVAQEYVIEYSEARARFFTNGARIETAPNVPYELVLPYSASQAPMLSTQQSFDRLYIDHAVHPPGAIARTSAVTFVYAATEMLNGPFLDQNSDKAVKVSANAASGSVTITATSAIFSAAQVNALFFIEALDFSDLKAWEPGMEGVLAGELVRSNGNAYQAESAGNTGSDAPRHASGSEWDGQGKTDVLNAKGPYGIKWKHLHGRFGIVRITAFASATSVTATVLTRLPNSVVTVATHRWAHAAFSAANGWPSVVVNAFGRQIHFKDFNVHGSVVGDYGGGRANFARHTETGLLTPDMAFRRTIATEDPVLWAVMSGKKIVVGSASRELALGAINSALAISGDNIAAEPQSFYGSEAIFPLLIGTETLFVERGGRRLRAGDYDFGRDRYVANDLTASARHVTRGGIVQLAHQRSPYALLHAVRSDGQLVTHPLTRIDTKGFCRLVPGGAAKILSAVAVIGEDGRTDELWCLVERQRADGLKREIWKQAAWRDLGDTVQASFFVDGGVQATGAAGQTVFTGLTHLAGQAVAVLANGGVVPGITISADGTLTLPATAVPAFAYTLAVGLPYTAIAVTLRPELRQRGETVQGLRQRVVKAVLRLLETMGLKVGDYDGPGEDVIDRPGNAEMDGAIPLFSGDTTGDIDGQFDRRGQIRFESADPLPAVISTVMLSVDVDPGNG